MKKIRFIIAVLISNLLAVSVYCQNSPKDEIEAIRKKMVKTHRDIDWSAYDPTSKLDIDSINYAAIRGVWKAYNGLFKFNGSVNSMVLTTPLVIEFKEDGYRPGKDTAFKKFSLKKNHIESKEEDFEGYINKITDNLLVITWNSGENCTRYYYER
jgi:hypothetical protein